MSLSIKISAKDYYELLPSATHSTGDIWKNLPSFGLLKQSCVTGIVITPACDLAQRKCETITYLPIVSVQDYIGSTAFYHETWKAAQEVLSKLKLDDYVAPPGRYELPLKQHIDNSIRAANIPKLDDGKRALIKRLESYGRYIKIVLKAEAPDISLVENVLSKKKFDKLLSSLVTNGFRNDIHFLPADGRPASYSAVSKNSVVLFRYPLTVPISILDRAQSSDEEAWLDNRKIVSSYFPSADHFSSWPVRLSRLKDDFLSDLLSRYLAMYIRLGSRDFTEGDVCSIVGNIKEMK